MIILPTIVTKSPVQQVHQMINHLMATGMFVAIERKGKIELNLRLLSPVDLSVGDDVKLADLITGNLMLTNPGVREVTTRVSVNSVNYDIGISYVSILEVTIQYRTP